MPPTNANSTMTRLLTGSNDVPPTAPEIPPNSAPAQPAMNPDTAKMATLARRTPMPSVAAASSLSRRAVSWRPNQLRRMATTPTESAQKTSAAHIANAASELVERRSEEHTSELQSLMRISYYVFFL